MLPLLSVIIPSRKRVSRLHDTVDSLFRATTEAELQCVVVADRDDAATIRAARDMQKAMGAVLRVVTMNPRGYVMPAWNEGLRKATGEWILPASDDLDFEPGWYTKALTGPNSGFIGLNDGHTRAPYSPVYMVNREYIARALGGCVVIPHYRSWYSEIEVAARTHRAHSYVWREDVVVMHHHPAWGDMPHDDTHKRGEQWHAMDLATFAQRRVARFPNDFEPVINTNVRLDPVGKWR